MTKLFTDDDDAAPRCYQCGGQAQKVQASFTEESECGRGHRWHYCMECQRMLPGDPILPGSPHCVCPEVLLPSE